MREKTEEDNVIETDAEEGDENRNTEITKEASQNENFEYEDKEGSEKERNEEDNVMETNTEETALQEIVNSPYLSRGTKKRCEQLLENRIKYRQEFKEKVKHYNLRSREKNC